jgi:gas vesicle protein
MDRDGIANFLLGLGIGVGIGMLFAPKSGEETRGMIMDKANEGTDYLKRQTQGMRESANDLIDKGRDMIGRQRDNLNDAIEAGKQAYREKVEPNASQVSQA